MNILHRQAVRRRGMKGVLLAGAALALGGLTVGAAQAAATTDSSTSLDEVVITAPHYVPTKNTTGAKTDTALIETPQSISVIPRDQIDVLNFESTQQAVRYTAGVVGENFGPDQRYDYVTVRGFYPVEYIDGLRAPIAPNNSLNDIGVDLWGFESIQILKGPASVLYGGSPPGGLLNLTSRRPEDTFGGVLRAQYGNYDEYEFAGDVTGPILPNLDGRLTSLYRDANTQLEFENHRRFYIAPAVTWNIDPSTKLTLLSFYQDDRDKGCCGGFLPAAGTLLPNPNGVIPTSLNLGEPGYNIYTRDEWSLGYSFSHAFDANWSFQQDLKYFSFKDNTKEVYGAGLGEDDMTESRYNFVFPEQIKEIAVDSRLQGAFKTGDISHTLLLGVDFRDTTNYTQFGFALAPSINIFDPVYGAPIAQQPLYGDENERDIQTGVYAQDQIKWNGFVLTIGGREDWISSHTAGSSTSVDAQKFTYRAGLTYVFHDGLAPYISYATSFEPTPGADFAGTPFAPSTGTQVEGGVKFEPTFLPRAAHVLVTAAAYDIVQDNVLTPDPNPEHPYSSVQTGQVEVKGIELEGVARLFDRISLNGSYTYTDSDVTKGTVDVGNRLFETPLNKLSLFADYTQQTGTLAGLGAGLGGRYLSSSFGDQANMWENPAVTLFDAIIHYDFNHFRVAVNANNLLDKIYVARCSSAEECFYGERRTVIVTLSRKW